MKIKKWMVDQIINSNKKWIPLLINGALLKNKKKKRKMDLEDNASKKISEINTFQILSCDSLISSRIIH